VPLKVALIYNEPLPDRYGAMGESKAELGVLDEVKAVKEALAELKYDYSLFPLHPPLSSVKEILRTVEADVVFNLFEGFDGSPETEGLVAEMLADLHLAYTGCPAFALKLALDKVKTKQLLSQAGINTPRYQILTPVRIKTFDLSLPCLVKPVNEDSSHGLSEDSVVYDVSALKKQVEKISAGFGGQALVEEYLDGREFNTVVMGNRRLSVPAISEILFDLPPGKPRILTFASKWEEDSLYFISTKPHCPARITPGEQARIIQMAKAAFRVTGCRGYARADFREGQPGEFYVLEVNPNPDITPGSGAALQAVTSGMTYSRFVEKIIRLALKAEK
jgi:D-alanine-D-alanine ligase